MIVGRSSSILLALAIAIPIGGAAYSPAIAGERAHLEARILGQYQSETHKAVQEVLRAKGYYSGNIDGRFGPASRAALLKFRADQRIPGQALKLDDALVNALFGLPRSGIRDWRDEACLLGKLGKMSSEESAGACRGAAPAEYAGEAAYR